MDCITNIIAENLRKIRNARHLSLDEVAELTGVSKSMLGQIERGDANPTIGSLLKISGGLKVELFDLMKKEEGSADLFVKEIQRIVKEEKGKYIVTSSLPVQKNRTFELYQLEIHPEVEYVGSYFGENSHVTLTVTSGEVVVKVIDKKYELKKGDVIEFESESSHSYFNSSEQIAEMEIVLSYWR